MQWNLMWWLDNHTTEYIHNSLIVVGLTDESRISWYDPHHERGGDDPDWNNYLHAQWLDGAGPNVDKGWFELHKHYLNMTACNELYDLNYKTTVRLFDGIGASYNIPVVQFNLLASSTVAVDTVHDINTRSVLESNYKPNGHPNEKGHQLIADKLILIVNTLTK